ncbi:phosphoinositide phospholipase C 4-like, partial [Curcuma longa]|uniref:phosphoinositide phospholipase C 4-like n=1 Tax=Curcuma longa TaxID=136217 RepID=UPI003D9F081C
MGSYRCCFFFTRKFRWSEAQPPEDVKAVFASYAEGGVHMSADQFRRFLVEAQGEIGATVADAERVIEQVRLLSRHPHLAKISRTAFLTFEDFHHYLFSVELNPPIQSQ